jgi:TrmH family RNA methyltransferase
MSFPLKPLNWYKGLNEKKGRLQTGFFLVEGDRAIRQILTAHPDAINEIITVEKPPKVYHDYPVRLVTESQLHKICHTKTPQGIAAVVGIPVDIYSNNLPQNTGNKVLLLEDIQDPGNAGTLIRTAAAFDFSGVILTENSADPLGPKCVQATAGTVLSVWLRRTKDYLEIVRVLKERGYTLIAADLKGTTSPSILKDHDRIVLALGNEAAGLSKALLNKADYRLRIPTVREKAESLNVAACGAILMYLSTQT